MAVGIGVIWLTTSLFPQQVFALGLGPLSLYSYINEPLDADVELLDVGSQPLEEIRVRLASEKDFQKFGIEHPAILSALSFELLRLGEKTFVRIKSELPVKQPYLNVLLDLSWSKKSRHLIRGYKLLLEPSLEKRLKVKQKQREERREQAIQPLETLFEPDQPDPFVQRLDEVTLEPLSGSGFETGSEAHLDNIAYSPESSRNSKSAPKKMVSESLPVGPEEMAVVRGMEKSARRLWVLITCGVSGLAAFTGLAFYAVRAIRRRNQKKEDVFFQRTKPEFPVGLAPHPVLSNEMGLKLELARRYAEMKEGVLSMELLKEVSSQGTEEEKEAASQLLAKLA